MGKKKTAMIGIISGCASLLGAPIALLLPGFLINRGTDAPREVYPLVYITAGFVYAPIAFVLGIFGVIILVISVQSYARHRAQEYANDLTRRCS